jgi:hypothetical protein
MNDESSFNILHVKNGLVEDLGANFLVFSNVDNFIDSLFSFPTGKIKNPIIKTSLLKLSKLILNPEIRFLICAILIKLRFMEGKVEMIVL